MMHFSMTLQGFNIGSIIKKLFGFKRFASVEFTAKQAFENIDVAMILLQVLLLFTLFAGGWFFIVWVLAERRRKHARQLSHLVHRLAAENVLLQHFKKLSKSDEQDLKLSKKDSLKRITQMLGQPFIKKVLSKHQMKIIFTMLQAFEENELDTNQQNAMITHLFSLFEKV